MEHITETFVINLTEATDRMRRKHADLEKNNIPYTRWNATRGAKLTTDELTHNTSFICRNFLCNNGVIGCYMSHLRLWQHIASSYQDPQWFMILEDDATILPGFHDNLQKVFQEMQAWPSQYHAYPEVIHLACMQGCNIIEVTPHLYTVQMFQTARAYVISVSGATKLAQMMNTIHFHVDVMLSINNAITHKVAMYATKAYVGNMDNFQSTISHVTFPSIFRVFIVHPLLQLFNLEQNNIHIFFQSPFFSILRTIDVNITIIAFIIIIALLSHFQQYIWLILFIMIEMITTLFIHLSHKYEK